MRSRRFQKTQCIRREKLLRLTPLEPLAELVNYQLGDSPDSSDKDMLMKMKKEMMELQKEDFFFFPHVKKYWEINPPFSHLLFCDVANCDVILTSCGGWWHWHPRNKFIITHCIEYVVNMQKHFQHVVRKHQIQATLPRLTRLYHKSSM